MPVNYTIQAEVIDINSDIPSEDDTFLVDSNVWFWATYSNASVGAKPYQINDYPNYLNTALANGAKIRYTGLSFVELAHLIEKTGREIYAGSFGLISAKEYLHNLPTERAKVVGEVQVAWGQIKTLANPIDLEIDENTTDVALNRYQNQLVDGYDLFILEAMFKHNILQVMTDDGDFATVPKIKVFTANRNVINAARNQGKLITR